MSSEEKRARQRCESLLRRPAERSHSKSSGPRELSSWKCSTGSQGGPSQGLSTCRCSDTQGFAWDLHHRSYSTG
eukprot:3080618-Amphidinium_carterae.1